MSCASAREADDNLTFANYTGEVTDPKSDCHFDPSPMKFAYNIDWPATGYENLINNLREWIVIQAYRTSYRNILSEDPRSGIEYPEGQSFEDAVKNMSRKFFEMSKGGCVSSDSIRVIGERNSPAEGYLTIKVVSTVVMSEMPEFEIGDMDGLTLRLSDGAVFPADNAIGNWPLMRDLIVKHYGEWDDYAMVAKSDIPKPDFPVTLSKKGVEINYNIAALYALRGQGFPQVVETITVPFEEALPALTQKARDFLPKDWGKSKGESADPAGEMVEEDPEEAAVKTLYNIFYKEEALKDKYAVIGCGSSGYSPQALRKFKELGINSELNYPVNARLAEANDSYIPYYTDSLNELLYKVDKAMEKIDDFETKLIMYGEFEGDTPFNLEIKKVKVVSPEKVVITASENPDLYDDTYVLVKQTGRWYIDDIYSYREKAKNILGI